VKKLLYFYGEGCPDCARVARWADHLEADGKAAFDRFEVWNDADNEARKAEYADLFTAAYGRATIVPAFVDVEGKRALCDPKTPEELNAWVVE